MDYLHGRTLPSFLDDDRTADAVERCLERICEAVIKIGAVPMATISPQTPVFQIRGLGNLLRHEYEAIDRTRIYETATIMLPPLLDDCQRTIDQRLTSF